MAVLLPLILLAQLGSANGAQQQPAAPLETCESKNLTPFSNVTFNGKGADFGPWVRRFVARVKSRWQIPEELQHTEGCTILTITIARDGSVSEVKVLNPSETADLTRHALTAIKNASAFAPLPSEYPDDHIEITAIFFYGSVQPPPSDAPVVTPNP